MNGFDVRAIGWVVAGDACADIARTLVGVRRRVPVDVLQSLGTHWQAVLAALREDPRGPGLPALRPLGNPLSATSEGAVADFVLQMVSCCPQRYSEAALRGRCVSAAAQALVGFLGGAAAASFTTPERELCADVAVVMLVMAGCLVLSTIQLWRTYRVVRLLQERVTCIAASRPGAAGQRRVQPD